MSEHDEQAALIAWANYQTPTYPELEMLFAAPNGGHRHKATAARLKAEGVKPGVPDLLLPVGRDGYVGLVIEMKFGRNKLTGHQAWWFTKLSEQGWKTAVCYSFEEAQGEIMRYLGI